VCSLLVYIDHATGQLLELFFTLTETTFSYFAATRFLAQRLTALRAIDAAITASLDLRLTLNVLLDQVTAQLGVDAADVLLFDPHLQILEYTAGRGFRTSAITRSRLRLGDGHAGRAIMERRLVSAPNC
jgi:hypothetical protein